MTPEDVARERAIVDAMYEDPHTEDWEAALKEVALTKGVLHDIANMAVEPELLAGAVLGERDDPAPDGRGRNPPVASRMLSADDELVEAVSEVEHDQWVAWASEVQPEVDGERAERWDRYMVPYEMLSNDVKEHDRKWARRVLAAVQSHLNDKGTGNEAGLRLTYWHPGSAEPSSDGWGHSENLDGGRPVGINGPESTDDTAADE